jgi:hypothetical protein
MKTASILRSARFPSLLIACGAAATAAASDVTALAEGSLLTVAGDSAANNVAIIETSAGDVVVVGLSGTTVNGRRAAVFRAPAFSAAEVRLEDGDDLLVFAGLRLSNDFFVNLGAGADQLFSGRAPSSIGNNFTVEGESGFDVVRLSGTTVAQDLDISGGIGPLTVDLLAVEAGNNLTVIGDLLDDSVTIEASSAGGAISVETKEGADTVAIAGATAFTVSVTTDAGVDVVSLSDVSAGEDISVSAGPAADSVDLVEVAAGKNLTVLTDVGDDTVVATAASAVSDAVFDGGDGVDVLDDNGITGGEKKEIKGFETIL